MGNCLIRQNKMIIKVIKLNGEVVEHKPPIKVHANHHSISGVALPESVKNPSTTVRIKLVVTKQELEVMLKKGGVSVADLVSQIENKGSLLIKTNDGRWKPGLESIPESC